ncbi:phosphonate metabolism transcriptional regulator PhnF [Caryophanon latum]|uniref:Phosphonate metabolism transcriptional regulator PhnF n=1 Tax=Caryophanon latum TaxID=33977 RepID=A0A1C0YJC8_9BACL|nr:phosphonate metabolism transcriptional regulator PhnF [Caryophanon latum]OCS87251.1 phosphonate metabolism transcriptional regulator PhnF [Caryophanon latum]
MLDKTSHIPIYVQIEDYIKQQIADGTYKQGEMIPSEREFAEMYQVSRMTVRQAITNLVGNGQLYREKGKGTFVTTEKMEQSLNSLTSFTEDMLARGLVPTSEVLSFEVMIPPAEVAKELQLAADETVYFITRIRHADNIPMALERTYIPTALFPNLQAHQLTQSLYKIIEQQYGTRLHYADQHIEAGIVSNEDRKHLQLAENAVVLIMQRKTFLLDQRPVEFVRSTYRADRYKFHNRIERRVL